jgi:hypothetical protein
MLGASLFFHDKKNSPKGNILFLKGNILSQIFFSRKHPQKINHKLFKKESIATIIATIDYNFEKNSKNVCLEQFKIVQNSCHPSCIKKKKKKEKNIF